MLKNHLKIAFRRLIKNKVFAGLNILGLSLGMALTILIALFIQSEFNYDNWIAESDRTYRVYRIGNQGMTVWTPGQLANKLVTDYPEVEAATGFVETGERLLSYVGNDMYVEETAAVDSTFFQVLGMDLLYGDPETVLDQPNSMVISSDLAQRIFSSTNPVGEVMLYDGETEYTITGVLDRKDKKSHIDSDIFTRFTWYGDTWIGNNRATYTRLKPSADPDQLAQKIEADVNELIRQEFLADNYTVTEDDLRHWALQPLEDIYLKSEGWMGAGERTSSMRNVFIFGLIAILVLLIAVINYVNLNTAYAGQRSKEVGVKKVTGAGKGLLTTQFMTEATLQSIVAGVFALLLAKVSLPFFNGIVDRALELHSVQLGWAILGTLGLALLIGLLAGSYPAFVLAAFKPVNALKSDFLQMGGKGIFRKVLVTIQFTVTITLFIIMGFIYKQVNYMLDKDLGFQPDQILTISMNSGQSHRRVEELKMQFKQIPGVKELTTTSSFPGHLLPDWNMQLEGKTEQIVPRVLFSDADFAKTLDIELVAGRFIDEGISSDSINNFIVNEAFVKRYGIENPIGQRLKWPSDERYGQVVGVMKNFHYRGLAEEIEPLVMNAYHWRNYVGIKLSTDDIPKTIAAIKELWAGIEPTHPMRYSFLDDDFAALYNDQQRFGSTIFYATILTLFIALLGLFGLTAFNVERRTKEIGIRKVLGSSVGGILGLLTQDFVKLVSFAFLIALPLGYLLSNWWLADFAHRTNLTWWVFLLSGLVILIIGFLTVCLQSLKAALTNPVDSLRSE